MTVGVQGDADVGMPEAFLHDLGVHADPQPPLRNECRVPVALQPTQMRASVWQPLGLAGAQSDPTARERIRLIRA